MMLKRFWGLFILSLCIHTMHSVAQSVEPMQMLRRNAKSIDSITIDEQQMTLLRYKIKLDSVTNKYRLDSLAWHEELYELQQQLFSMKKQLFTIDSLQQLVFIGEQTQKNNETWIVYLEQLRDSLYISNSVFQKKLEEKNNLLEEKVKAFQEKEFLFSEKEKLYRDAINNSNVDKIKLEGLLEVKNVSIEAKAREIEYLQKHIIEKETSLDKQIANYQKMSIEREQCRLLVDTLQVQLNESQRNILRINEELKYTQQRAREAEEKIAQATSKKKKVRVIQGLAMRLYRTPDWSTRPVQISENGITSTVYKITNKNSGSVEFDFVTGASVMLWDLTDSFNKSIKDTTTFVSKVKRFDQKFSYDIGLYVGFGGSNLFKNFYVGPSFKFLDFFHFTIGANIAEYESLVDGLREGDQLPVGFSIDDQTTDEWKVTMFISISLDLDFMSYIRR